MVRPCVASGFVDLVVSGLASMYPVSSWSRFAPDHHGYQRACDLINGQASTGHPGHQCSHAPGRPILHLYLSPRRPRLETVDGVTSSLAPHTDAVPLFEPRAVPSSRPAERRSRRAQGRSRPAVALRLAAGSGVARPRLDRAGHGARIKRVGRLAVIVGMKLGADPHSRGYARLLLRINSLIVRGRLPEQA
jgi:hypothetical protein